MKYVFCGLLIFVSVFMIAYNMGIRYGEEKVRNELPSCLYLDRNKTSEIKPYGCDKKEGIDYIYDRIDGGGMYISLHPWKCKN